jgi:hypothetical protein
MEADRIVAVEVEAVAWDRRAVAAIDQQRLEVPEDLDAHSLREHLEARFGGSTGTVNTEDEAFGDIVVGWLFPADALAELGMDHPGATLLAVPYVRFANGVRKELAIYNAELQARFADLARSLSPDGSPPWSATEGPSDADLLGGGAPEKGTRLAEEQLRLYHSDRDGIRLELEGWLRRLLAEGYTFIVIEVGHLGRYLQFVTHDGSWLRGEVVGPTNLRGCPPLDEVELLSLHAGGWNDPEEDAGIGNFWLEWGDPEVGEPVDVEHAAHLAALTLDAAFGPIDPESVEITTGSSHPSSDR